MESAWIPDASGYSLYIRPTIIGTRTGVFAQCIVLCFVFSWTLMFSPALGVAASDSAILYVILSPTGPYFRGEVQGIPLLAVGKTVRAWPGGTGDHKLGLNYAPAFLPQRIAAKQGYQQILWLLGEESRITEAGAMNFFAVVKRDDDGTNPFSSYFINTDLLFFRQILMS
jgi:branched-chain amino acid aminotransferase